MGLNASVMCRCFVDGKTSVLPFADNIKIDEDGRLFLDLPYEENHDKHNLFRQWIDAGCEHARMNFLLEYLSNWTGYRSFQQTLAAVGWEHFPTLKAELPESNGGLTESTAAAKMLQELEFFTDKVQLGSTTVLVDADSGEELHEYIEAYDGVFHFGADGINMGVDEKGFFICDQQSRELFRSMKFRQTLFTSGLRKLFKKSVVEFVDVETEKIYRCRAGVMRISNWPDGRFQDSKGRINFEYPAMLEVMTKQRKQSEFEYILTPLCNLCRASIETGNPIRWS